MKLHFPNYLLVVAGLAFACGPSTLRADLEVNASVSIHSEADFYEPLAAHGGWIEVDTYGRCWRPTRVAVEWQPYCEGHWVWTDCGWYWDSDEPWGWACYHYGRWYYHPVHHWIWIPGREWAPAWVSWRAGGTYIGWAPLPPASVVIAGPAFVFVQSGRFHEPVRRSNVIVNNTTIINETKVINNVRTETRTIAGAGPRKVYVNEGPGVDVVQKATKQTIKPQPIQEVARKSAPAEFVRKQADRPDSRDDRNERAKKLQTPGTPQTQPQPEPAKPDQKKVAPSDESKRAVPPQEPKRVAPPDRNPKPSVPPNVDKPKRSPGPAPQVDPNARPGSKGGRPPGKDHDEDRGGQDRGKGKPDA